MSATTPSMTPQTPRAVIDHVEMFFFRRALLATKAYEGSSEAALLGGSSRRQPGLFPQHLAPSSQPQKHSPYCYAFLIGTFGRRSIPAAVGRTARREEAYSGEVYRGEAYRGEAHRGRGHFPVNQLTLVLLDTVPSKTTTDGTRG